MDTIIVWVLMTISSTGSVAYSPFLNNEAECNKLQQAQQSQSQHVTTQCVRLVVAR